MRNIILPFAAFFFLVTGVVVYANNQRLVPSENNPLEGKVVIVNPSSIAKPYANVRIEKLAGKSYLIHGIDPEGGNAYDSWIAFDEIARMRVF